jgi:hypothetical protein
MSSMLLTLQINKFLCYGLMVAMSLPKQTHLEFRLMSMLAWVQDSDVFVLLCINSRDWDM